ncbi:MULTISPECIES: biotin--[acetyl-CoA-carboxylase] ligase [unclassified Paludibacterium]|uniref:biotin--[acetyl-CoA-carboxylase] ligase n=1 Tax=unclassified Paludibacterium TaxID=2618429 RepID=UPI001C04F75E|nr:biotin--[acetyl-CoA-carboxylase] ligase [Paludibacterium sp. B53371]BEV72845.1 bifunctional biotin--[acetyl-CoA-carboxylase] ligase/biotin operon repressor BirA [Paludibacterium sp. THUN1379]
MADWPFAVLRALSDGKFHSGEAIAQQLGCSRTLIWQAVHTIQTEFQLPVFSVRGQGYRLVEPFDWLDVATVRAELSADCAETWTLAVADQVDSTNTQLMNRANSDGLHGLVLAAELQSAGRGRLGRAWHARLGDCLMFSLLWRFDRGLAELAGLSLAIGLALARVLRALGAPVELKWPNDVLLDGRKMAGILIELSGDALGPAAVVIGIGINLQAPQGVDQAVAGLRECGIRISRNHLLALLLNELHQVLCAFNQHGFEPLASEWMALSTHQDKPVRLSFSHGQPIEGVARGVAGNGALLVDTPQGRQVFHVGEVSLRSAT